MRLANEHMLTIRIDDGERKSKDCVYGQSSQRWRDFASTGLARGSCRQCIGISCIKVHLTTILLF